MKVARVDLGAIEEALRVLGLLYGAKSAPAEAVDGACDEAAVIRAYLIRERPHLLASYEIESLVALVQSTINRRAEHGSAMEQFAPRH